MAKIYIELAIYHEHREVFSSGEAFLEWKQSNAPHMHACFIQPKCNDKVYSHINITW